MLSIGPVYTNTEGLIWFTTPGDTDVLDHIAQPALPDLKWVRTYSEYSEETILTPQDLTYVNVTKHQVSGILNQPCWPMSTKLMADLCRQVVPYTSLTLYGYCPKS